MAKQGRAGMGLWDRLVLLVAWVVTCGLVYLLGIYVGKGMQERLLGHEDRVVRLPVTTAPPRGGEQPKPEKELTFYDTLVRETETGRPARGADASPRPQAVLPAAAPASAAKPAPPATIVPPAAVRPTPPPGAVTPAAVRTPPPIAPTPARPIPLPGVPTSAAGAPVREREGVAAVPPPPAPTPVVEAPAPRAGTGNWTVLANPTRSQDEADGLARQLRGRGYAASVVRVLREGDTWYRVAVGRFASSEQATEMMQRLREREGVAHVFVASE